jgi:hypothetical protein
LISAGTVRFVTVAMAVTAPRWRTAHRPCAVTRAAWTAMSDDKTYLTRLEPYLDGLRKAGVPE